MATASGKAAGSAGKRSPYTEIAPGNIPATIGPEAHWEVRSSEVSKGNMIERILLGVLGNGVKGYRCAPQGML